MTRDMDLLPIEIIQDILEYCSIESILSIGQTNSYLRKVVKSNTIWRSLLKRLKRFRRFPGLHIQEPERAFRELYAFSKTGFYDWIYLAESAVYASSTDNVHQSIDNVLSNDSGFWSSAGSPDVNSNEEIVLSLIGLSIVSCVRLRPYRAAYQALSPIYAPQAVQIYIGVDSKNWVEIPIIFTVDNTHNLQMLDVSEYCTIGDSVKLVLKGRQKQQLEDGLWYTVLEKVDVYGIALSESTPYLSSIMVNECEKLEQVPKFIQDPPKSYSQALELIDSFGNIDALFDYVIHTPPYGAFRNSEILPEIWKTHDAVTVPKLRYFELLERTQTGHPWTDFESVEFIKLIISVERTEMIWRFFRSEVQLTEEIGDLIFAIDPELALAIYSERSCMDKILKCLLHLSSFRQALHLLSVARYPQSHYLHLMRQMPLDKSKEFAKSWIDLNPNIWAEAANALGVSHLNSLETLKEWLNS